VNRAGRDSERRLERAAVLIADRLNALRFEWRAVGPFVEGPGTTRLIAAAIHSDSPRHLDIGFVGDRTQPEQHVLWDCTTGLRPDLDEALAHAVDVWSQVTAPVLLELLTLRGDFADHFHGDDPYGFPGWHAIGGIIAGWGHGVGVGELREWALTNPLLPSLRDSLAPLLPATRPVGLKLYFGASAKSGETTEVRVDGSEVPGPSAVLASLAWPRCELAYVKTYFLLIHPEAETAEFDPNQAR
jgi:hypothetical protein